MHFVRAFGVLAAGRHHRRIDHRRRRAGEARSPEHGCRLPKRDGDPWAWPSPVLAEKVKKMSGGSIDMRFFEPGALVPASQYFDAVAAGSLDFAWTSLGFFTGKDIAFAMFSSVPFGPELGEYLGWMKHGGGEKMMQELSAQVQRRGHALRLDCAGSLRLVPPARSRPLDDLKGLKMRFFGLGVDRDAEARRRDASSCRPVKSSRRCSSARSTRPSSRCRRWTSRSASIRSPSTTTSRAGTRCRPSCI